MASILHAKAAIVVLLQHDKMRHPITGFSRVITVIYLLVSGLLVGCVEQRSASSGGADDGDYARTKVTKLEDWTYEANIRSIMFYPASMNKNAMLDLPVVFLGEQQARPLSLSFDELGNDYRNYFVKILACNYDWTPGILQDLEYLYEFNEFPITTYELSSGTRVPYTHYQFTVPPVKISGNYVLKVYRNQDPDDVILTRRFVVFENAVTINLDVKFSLDPSFRFSHQQVDFEIRYPKIDLFNPADMVKVVVRQNGRWDNAITDLKPAFIRDEIKTLDYHLLNNENIFPGGNEWRAIDARSMRFMGQGVDAASFDNNKAEVVLMMEKSRNQNNYNQLIDANGRYIIENFETRNSNVVPDYQFINFRFQQPQLPGEVYVFGAMSDFRTDPRFRMRYDSAQKCYTARILLKQGYYNYAFAYRKPGAAKLDDVKFEGSYNQTENLYDVIAYFRPIGARYDRVIGYNSLDYFDRDAKR